MIPSFNEYTGPYQVGTVDIEVPVSELYSAAPAPANTENIKTVLVRVYYPAVNNTGDGKIRWLPTPQRQNVSAYAQFMGLGSTASSLVSFLPRHMHYITIPAHKNATIAPSPTSTAWPTAIFSHGLAGCRNSYSYIAGSLASHGVIVFCPEHRDGSAVITMVRNPGAKVGRFTPWKQISETIPYIKLDHDATPGIFAVRAGQLRIRLWEMGLLVDLIGRLQKGDTVENLNESTGSLDFFKGVLDVEEPGKLIFMGHSFGAATTVQLLKSVYYAGSPELEPLKTPLYTPTRDSALVRQITPRTPTILLDMWCMPLFDPNYTTLLNLPLPAFAPVADAPGGSAVLAVESDQFYKWTEHLHASCRALSPKPGKRIVEESDFVNAATGKTMQAARFFYVKGSAHINQSDFGVLFPWVTKKIFSAGDPERPLRLNLRAILQTLRENNVSVSGTSHEECVDGGVSEKSDRFASDPSIFTSTDIQAWAHIPVVGMGAESPQFGWTSDTEDTDTDGKSIINGQDMAETAAIPTSVNTEITA